MGSLFVVNRDPLHAEDMSQIPALELTGIKHLGTERAVESFDVCVLYWTTWLSERPSVPLDLADECMTLLRNSERLSLRIASALPCHSHDCRKARAIVRRSD